jgi:LysR family transcriptional regulator for bpeEF and oprC
LFEDALADRRVRSLLIEHHGPPVPIHFVYAANRLLPRRARVFMDFIAAAFARDPALNADTGVVQGVSLSLGERSIA